jgi:hypothetical protein
MMRVPVFAPADATCALLLLTLLLLVAVRCFMPSEGASGFVVSGGVGVYTVEEETWPTR